MRIAILGTGTVGTTLGSALAGKGNEVRLGSRDANNPKAAEWAGKMGPRASHGDFQGAAAFGEVVFNCTAGTGSIAALEQAGREALSAKIVIDLSNPLDFSKGMPPSLSVCNTDSLGEQIQRAFPGARVVKSLNTMSHLVMVNPTLVPGDHNVFVCGNDAGARAQVKQWLGEWFGWKAGNILDLGDITAARGTEMVLPLWLRLYGMLGPVINFHIARGPQARG